MNYTVNGKNYTANDGYVFCHKESGAIFKKFRMARNDSLENYDVIPEPVHEEQETEEGTADD